MKVLNRDNSSQFIRYLLTGTLVTISGYVAIFICMYVLGINPYLSNLLVYAIGLYLSYEAHRSYTFRSRGKKLPEVAKFLTMFAVAYSANLGSLHLLLNQGLRPMIAQIAAGMVYVFSSFLLNRYVVYDSVRRKWL